MCIKLWENFRGFGWQENSWGINFCGHSGVVGTTVVYFVEIGSVVLR